MRGFQPAGAALACLLAAPLATAAATDPVAPVALSMPGASAVAATERVTLQQAVERALQTHPALAAAGYAVAASEGALDQARRLRNPEAAFTTEDVRRDRATMTAQLNIPLELGGKRSARTRAAEVARDATAQDAAVLQAELRADVTRAFFDLVIAQERLTLAQASDALAAQAESAAARRVQDRYRITPLDAFGKTSLREAEAETKVNTDKATDLDVSMEAARRRVTALDANSYFTRFAELLKDNPPHAADSTMLQSLRDLGIVPGAPFDAKAVSAAHLKVMDGGVAAARETLSLAVKQPSITQNGWFIPRMVGAYGLDYAQRAIVAWNGGGTDLPQDMLVATAKSDTNGMALDSTHRYVLHFDRNQLPPENAGWAIAALSAGGQPRSTAERPGLRNMLSEADHPRLNRDGSLDILIQRAPPKGMRNNWLPPPTGPFLLRMQLTWPKEAALDGSWLPPTLQRRDAAAQ